MDGLFCIFKGEETVFSNKEAPELLNNIVSGLDGIGRQLFSERIHIIRVPPLIIKVSFEDGFTIVATGTSESEVTENISRHEDIIDQFVTSVPL